MVLLLPGLLERWVAKDPTRAVSPTFDSSSKLARQVEAGAPADVVFFADAESMDDLDDKHLLAQGTRRDVLGNSLVVVVPAGSPSKPTSLADLAAVPHLALAAETVPAGRYARAALGAAGAWDAVSGHVVTGDNVRLALAWVDRGEAEADVVYATDAKADPAVEVAFAIPADLHPPVIYPAAVVAASAHPAEARDLLEFLGSAEATSAFTAAGFTK
jgi:molybdate transport system substrate-binding protein